MGWGSENFNLLIVSDLHLGADLKRGRSGSMRCLRQVDMEFPKFLDWYLSHKEGGRPWRLVVNGDMMDFINVSILPQSGKAFGFSVDEEDARCGLAGERSKSVWKLEQIFNRHRRVFEGLAAFLVAGNELVIVRGNHDIEFFWTEVQQHFVLLVETLTNGRSVEDQVRFVPWFYYEPGLIYVEHGNQYDEYSSFEYSLCPVAPDRSSEVETPLSHFAIRYLVNPLAGVSEHDMDRWKFRDYLSLGLRGKLRSLLPLLKAYFDTVCRVVGAWANRQILSHRGRRREHERHLMELSKRENVSLELLRNLGRISRRPGTLFLAKVLRCYYVDRILLYGVAFWGLAGIALFAQNAFLSVLLTLTLVWGVVSVGRFWERLRNTEVSPKLRKASVQVGRLLKVPFVVFGHSHLAQTARLGHEIKSWYFNVGTWLPTGSSGADRFTHLVVSRRRRPRAELRVWSPREGGAFPVQRPVSSMSGSSLL